jgi:hypothetical protein
MLTELLASLKARGIEYSDDLLILMENIECRAIAQGWNPKTLAKFRSYVLDFIKMELRLLNEFVVIFGETPRTSLIKARNVIKYKVIIGIGELNTNES